MHNGLERVLLEVYVVIVILAVHLVLNNHDFPLSDKYDFIEIFAGSARCARLGKFIFWKCIAIDAAYDKSMDMNRSGGFVLHVIAFAIFVRSKCKILWWVFGD